MQNKYTKILVILLGLPFSLFCQTNHGFSFDNYSGIYGVISNPANSVDSKYDIHVNALSYNQLGVSDIGTLPYFNVETSPNGFNGLDFDNNSNSAALNGNSFGHSDILLPSVVWNFHDNFAIGLLLRSRTLFDYNNVDSNLLKTANGEGPVEGFTLESNNLNNTAHTWSEVGLNLSAVLINANYHFVKFGGTFKYYMGTGANEIRGLLSGSSNGASLTLNTTQSNSLVSLNTYPQTTDEPTSKSFISTAYKFNGKGTGIGGDIGLVYEWRPRETNRVDVRSNSSAVNKYKLTISASVLDIGTINYSDARQNSISLNNASISNSNINSNGLINSILDESSTNNVTVNPLLGEAKFALPRSLHLNVDYIILNNKNYYINLNYIKGLTKSSEDFANTQMDLITVTPRFETRKFSIYLPINFEPTSGISAGIGGRYGPVTIGAAALSSMFTNNKISHLYFGLSIPLMKELYR